MIYFIKPPTAAFDPPTILLGKSFKRLPHPSGFKILVSFCDWTDTFNFGQKNYLKIEGIHRR